MRKTAFTNTYDAGVSIVLSSLPRLKVRGKLQQGH
jgi:hypothetical protein